MKKSFRSKIASGSSVVGTLVTLPSPEIAEILSSCGFDWLFIDMEHGAITVSQAQHLLQAVRGDCSALVRVPENSAVWIKKALDIGSDGVIVPQVNSAEDAERAVRAAKYPPLGERSVGPVGRAQGYGMDFQEYVKSANDMVAVIVQIEHIAAVENLDAILGVDGVDGVFIGPYDLSGSMGLLGEITHEKVQEAIMRVKQKCKEKEIPFGIFVGKAEGVEKEIGDGCGFVALGVDTMFLWGGAKGAVDIAKRK